MIRILIMLFLIPLITVVCISQKETTSKKIISEIKFNYHFHHETVNTVIREDMSPVKYVLSEEY